MNKKGIHTEIEEIVEIDSLQIIRENYFQFPKGKSNIYAKDIEDKIVWFAELPIEGDSYSNPMVLKDGKLRASSWKGFTVLINIKNGKKKRNFSFKQFRLHTQKNRRKSRMSCFFFRESGVVGLRKCFW